MDHKIEDSKKSVNSNRKWLEVSPAQYQTTSLDAFNVFWLCFCAEKNRGKENIMMTKKMKNLKKIKIF